jgi:hypothetical protein
MSLTPDIWMPTLRGRAIDMVEPSAVQVDFAETADMLASVYRYAGAAEKPVSVANHTLIADRCALAYGGSKRLRALVALHDCHETRIGEIPTPSARALAAIAGQMYGLPAAEQVTQALAELKRRHDIAIHKAASIAMPNAEEQLFIKRCDLSALATERRDCLGPQPLAWAAEVEAAPCLPQRIRLLPPGDAALKLHQLFLELLPGARAQSEREASVKARATGARVA